MMFEAYGGTNYGSLLRLSSKVHFSQRGANSAFVEVWEQGPVSGVVWYTKQISTYVFELWVSTDGYASDFRVELRSRSRWTSSFLMDSISVSPPSGLTTANVLVHRDTTQLDISPFRVGENNFNFASGWSGYYSSGWSGVVVARTGLIVSISGACQKSGSWSTGETMFTVPNNQMFLPYRQMQGVNCQFLASDSNNPPWRVVTASPGSTATSFSLTYIAYV